MEATYFYGPIEVRRYREADAQIKRRRSEAEREVELSDRERLMDFYNC